MSTNLSISTPTTLEMLKKGFPNPKSRQIQEELFSMRPHRVINYAFSKNAY